MLVVMSLNPHQLQLRVRYGETDQMGVVHHVNYLTYFEEGRTSMMADMGLSYAELERSGIGLPVRKLEIRYRASAHYEDQLCVETRVLAMRAASVTFGYEIRRVSDGALLVVGKSELACISLEGERGVKPLPEDLRRALEGALVEQ
jgi:acyl-CoA thioester hydrolase